MVVIATLRDTRSSNGVSSYGIHSHKHTLIGRTYNNRRFLNLGIARRGSGGSDPCQDLLVDLIL